MANAPRAIHAERETVVFISRRFYPYEASSLEGAALQTLRHAQCHHGRIIGLVAFRELIHGCEDRVHTLVGG